MNRQILALGLGIGAILLSAQHLEAQGRNCAERAQIVEHLAERYGESRQSVGLAGTDQVVELFASLETGTWTITVTTPSGQTCLVAAGRAFERLNEPLPSAAPGDPA